MKTIQSTLTLFAASLIIMFTVFGCSHEETTKVTTDDIRHPELSQEMLEQLAYADAHDGTVDHVVEDCTTCQLHMKGKEEWSASIGEYTLHLCTPRCQKMIEENPEGVLASFERIEETE